MPENAISRQDIETFHNDGFVIKQGLQAAEAHQIAAWADEVASWPEVPGKYMMYFETSLARTGRRLLSRIENFFPYYAGFRKLLTSVAMLCGAASLFGESAVLFKDKINFKLSGAGGFTPHQDVQAGWNKYADLHITAMVTIDPATRENGCLEIAAGHHPRGLGRMWEPLDRHDLRALHHSTGRCRVFRLLHAAPFKPQPERPSATRALPPITDVPREITDRSTTRTSASVIPPDCERESGRQYRFKV